MGILEWINVTRSLNCTSLMFSKTFPVTDAINSLIHAGLYQMKIKFISNYFYFGTKRPGIAIIKRLFSKFYRTFMIERVKDLL